MSKFIAFQHSSNTRINYVASNITHWLTFRFGMLNAEMCTKTIDEHNMNNLCLFQKVLCNWKSKISINTRQDGPNIWQSNIDSNFKTTQICNTVATLKIQYRQQQIMIWYYDLFSCWTQSLVKMKIEKLVIWPLHELIIDVPAGRDIVVQWIRTWKFQIENINFGLKLKSKILNSYSNSNEFCKIQNFGTYVRFCVLLVRDYDWETIEKNVETYWFQFNHAN